MNPGANNRLVNLFKTVKTICIGRFLLDVPDESDVIYGPTRLPFLIERSSGGSGKFDDAIEERLGEIAKNDAHRARGALTEKDSVFGKVINGAANDQRIVFGADKAAGSLYAIYSIQQVGPNVYTTKTAGYGDNYRDAVAKINAVASLLRPRIEDEIPVGPGICLDGAFLKDPKEPIKESVSLGVRLRQFPDVHFSLEMIKKDRIVEDDSLEARIAAAEEGAQEAGIADWYKRAIVFRRGPRTIGKWSGYEYLAWKPAIGRVVESHEFGFFSHGEPHNAMSPTLDVALDTGVKGNRASGISPSITHDEAVYLWDRITASIRPRPVGSTK